jgi:hypothetical protein
MPNLGDGIALVDFNTDGKMDLVTGGRGGISFLLGDGTGDFPTATTAATLFPQSEFVIGDFNRDGRPDIVAARPRDTQFTVLINTSPRGCVDTVKLTYAAGTLTIRFTLKNAVPSQWSAWVAVQSRFIQLWALSLPAIPTAVSFDVPIPGVPPSGNIAVLTTMNGSTYGLMCANWKIVDTGGIGPTAQTLSRMPR